MKRLNKIVKEEIERVLKVISEENLHANPDFDVFEKNKEQTDNIIYNYEIGREFANNTLQVDINNLNTYNLVEYLPKSISQEKWGFDFVTTIGTTLTVDIIREIRGGKSFWSMIFGILYIGENIPVIKDMIESVEGYDNFIKAANSGIANKIDSSKY